MEQRDIISIPMTQMEFMLKQYISLRPDIERKILSPDEFSDYLAWMARAYEDHSENRYTLNNIPIQIFDPFHRNLAQRIMDDPDDTQAFSLLSTAYEKQSENQHILASHDISVGRMLRYMPDQWHAADHFMIYYARSGETIVHFENDTIVLKQGSVLIIAPNVVHANICFADNCVVWYFLVRASTFDRVFWNQLSESSLMSRFFRQALSGEVGTAYLYFDTFTDEEIVQSVSNIITEFNSAYTYRSQMLNAQMSMFFILLLRKYEGTARLPRTVDFFWKHEFSAIFSYIQSHFADASISDISDHFHYSKRQISRIIQKYVGMSYAHLILKLKMDEAATMLRQGNNSIAQVSSAVGYADVSSFYRAFTKYYHKTPLEFSNEDVQN